MPIQECVGSGGSMQYGGKEQFMPML